MELSLPAAVVRESTPLVVVLLKSTVVLLDCKLSTLPWMSVVHDESPALIDCSEYSEPEVLATTCRVYGAPPSPCSPMSTQVVQLDGGGDDGWKVWRRGRRQAGRQRRVWRRRRRTVNRGLHAVRRSRRRTFILAATLVILVVVVSNSTAHNAGHENHDAGNKERALSAVAPGNLDGGFFLLRVIVRLGDGHLDRAVVVVVVVVVAGQYRCDLARRLKLGIETAPHVGVNADTRQL
eukprot:scaffold41510_cov65-Phaeocystis_antarctica.AAC.2